MRTEYLLNTYQKAEIRRIDDQILKLTKQKAEIYARANVRYVTETIDEAQMIERWSKELKEAKRLLEGGTWNEQD